MTGQPKLEQDEVGESVLAAIRSVQLLYPDEVSWTTNVSCDTPNPVDFRIKRLLYVEDKKVAWLDIEMY